MYAELTKDPLKHQDIETYSNKIDELPPDILNTENQE